jgi:hypothetical protein
VEVAANFQHLKSAYERQKRALPGSQQLLFLHIILLCAPLSYYLFSSITGVDLHTGGKLNLELLQDWIRLYLLRGSCGNTVAKFYSVIQHNYDSNAKLEGIEYGRLF